MLLRTSATIGTAAADIDIPKREPAASPIAANGVTLYAGCESATNSNRNESKP